MQKLKARESDADYQVQQQINGFDRQTLSVDVCVIGGGMAGMIAAISAARGGAKVVLVHDRPVLGGNASSEVRMWICGAHGRDMKETGILEEIQLENCYRNPTQIYSIWDSVLYEKAKFCPNLRVLLNATCNNAQMETGRIVAVDAWQLTSQIIFRVEARFFIDCSGDSVLAPLTGALVRVGREAASEFDEDIEPSQADNRTMGNSLLLQLREMDCPQPFVAPSWAYKIGAASDLPNRGAEVRGHNFWWLEVGGLCDTIRDAEPIRHELMKIGYGVWDYIKNYHPRKAEHENWTLEWFGSLPGKRENRRYVGAHILTQNDVRAGGAFEDIIAYGGWSMDDHHPAGLYYPGKPTIFHPAPSPFGIPYRCLYSTNVNNLLFAGRNISTTHAALSSTRVMGTTSMLGQAAGTAAALCVRLHCDPAGLYANHLAELQQQLMDDDQWLPGRRRECSSLTQTAEVSHPEIRNGADRPIGDQSNAFTGVCGEAVTLKWREPVQIGGLRLVFDSDLNQHKRMPCSVPLRGNCQGVPASMVRKFRIDAQSADGAWTTAYSSQNNYQRLVRVPLDVRAAAIRVVPEETWGADVARIFGIDALQTIPQAVGVSPVGPAWTEVVASIDPDDLAEPESGYEATDGRKRSGA